MSRLVATARALANVALVKYFGKRDLALNLPAAGSLSVALEPLETVTTVAFDELLPEDAVFIDGVEAPAAFAGRVSRFLDLVRERAAISPPARVDTRNSFPTGAGLASSASGFAALALASTAAAGLALSERELSVLARRGSGSAARSVPGGLAIWHEGRAANGDDSFARRILEPEALSLRLVVGISDFGEKAIGSTAAMERTRLTSPYFAAWIDAARADLAAAEAAVRSKDLPLLGEIAERSALAMHAAAIAARPGIVFWNGTTVEALHLAADLRRRGVGAWFTCDAGPQPKLICDAADVDLVSRELASLRGIADTIRCAPGGGASIVDR